METETIYNSIVFGSLAITTFGALYFWNKDRKRQSIDKQEKLEDRFDSVYDRMSVDYRSLLEVIDNNQRILLNQQEQMRLEFNDRVAAVENQVVDTSNDLYIYIDEQDQEIQTVHDRDVETLNRTLSQSFDTIYRHVEDVERGLSDRIDDVECAKVCPIKKK